MPSMADYLLANTSGGNFGTMSPGEEAVAVTPGSVLDAMARRAATLPKRAFEASEGLRQTGQYDPAPAVETATMMIGAPGVPAGAVGSSFRYPLYHGTIEHNLSVLNPSVRGPLGPGVYTSPAKQIADTYSLGEKTYELPAADRDIFMGAGHRTDEEWFGFKDDKQRLLNAENDPQRKAHLSELLDKTWSNDGYPLYQRLLYLYGTEKSTQNLFKRAGFEGISGLVDGPETLLFEPQKLSK